MRRNREQQKQGGWKVGGGTLELRCARVSECIQHVRMCMLWADGCGIVVAVSKRSVSVSQNEIVGAQWHLCGGTSKCKRMGVDYI